MFSSDRSGSRVGISFEHDAAWGPSTASSMLLPIPENKREIPCDDCPHASKCEVDFLECSAFRNWAQSGDFRDSDVGRLIRGAK